MTSPKKGATGTRSNVPGKAAVPAKPKTPTKKKETPSRVDANFKSKKAETDEDILKRINERFVIIDRLADSVMTGASNAMILSGPPGLGKTYTIDEKIAHMSATSNIEPAVVKGYVRTTAFFKTLWENRHPGSVVVFDDADSVFSDLNTINLMKAALDTSKSRWLTYGSEAMLLDSNGELVERHFQFEGQVIFITNFDFDNLVDGKHKFSEHFKALMSRSHYVSLEMRSIRDYLVRVRSVINTEKFIREQNIADNRIGDIIHYIEDNAEKLRELSIRSAVKINHLIIASPNDWKSMADLTMLKR